MKSFVVYNCGLADLSLLKSSQYSREVTLMHAGAELVCNLKPMNNCLELELVGLSANTQNKATTTMTYYHQDMPHAVLARRAPPPTRQKEIWLSRFFVS